MTFPSRNDSSDLRSLDPLDVRVAEAATTPAGPVVRAFPPRRSLLGWSATSIPVAPLLLGGIAFGPRGIGLLSAGALAFLDPVLPVALAVLGVLIGLGVGAHRAGDGHRLAIAGLETGTTMLVVAVGTAVIAPAVLAAPAVPVWMLGSIAGICAATSSTVPTGSPPEPGEHRRRVVEFGVLLAIVLGGLVLTSLGGTSLLAAISLAGQTSLVVLLLAIAGWLLLMQAASETEQRVFTVASLLLVGGAADYLSFSALLGGVLAGALWQRAGGDARESMRRDALYVQHPLLVLLLLVAGARVEFAAASLGLAVAYVFWRAAGKLAGVGMATRVARFMVPRDLGLQLLSPGVFGVALALNTVRVAGQEASPLLTIVVIGTIGSELLAALFTGREAAE